MVEAINLTKTYGINRGVQNVSFQIESGEIVGLVGLNGAGKTTIMKILAGYMPPTGGEANIDGISMIDNPREASKKIGFLTEIPALYDEMVVEEFLMFLAGIRGIKKKERKEHIDGIMKKCIIADVSQRLIRNLSKGYRQRVGFAQALVGSPSVLIFDEPTAGLDPKQTTEVRTLIKKLSENHTIIISSHILTEISAICEKVIIINEGELVLDRQISELSNKDKDNLLLRVRADFDKIQSILSGIKGVLEIIPKEHVDEYAEVLVTTNAGLKVRENIFSACSKAALPIVEMRSTRETLEDLFLRLTIPRKGAK